MSAVLELRGVWKRYGPTEIIRGVDLDIDAGERRALIGPNGAGKSTLLDLISGRQRPSAGKIRFEGRDVTGLPAQRIRRLGLSRSFQLSLLFGRLSVLENLYTAISGVQPWRYSCARLLGRQAEFLEHAESLLASVGLHERRAVRADQLAHGERRALELAMATAGGAQALLLDEPTAGMSRAEAAQTVVLIDRLTAGKTVLLVEHDMNIVFSLADRITVLQQGQVLATGTAAEIRADAAVRSSYLGEP
ncbi:MAG: ABC transporter ATP-binding protein [Gammaproteobacteria bacterium]